MLRACRWPIDKNPPVQALSETAGRTAEAPLTASLMDSLVSRLGRLSGLVDALVNPWSS